MYHKNSMATASLIFGILAILSGSVFIIAIGLGALSGSAHCSQRQTGTFPQRALPECSPGLLPL